MNSIGNDVVALAQVNAERTHQYRFYSKILSPAERSLYTNLHLGNLPFEYYVWLLWSVKESAYKFLKRVNPDLVFSPTKLNISALTVSQPIISTVSDTHVYSGHVTNNDRKLWFRSVLTPEYIHSFISADASQAHVYSAVHQINQTDHNSQSVAVREVALQHLSGLLSLQHLSVKKHNVGYPEIWNEDELLAIPLSLSHHQHYIAYAFELTA